MSTLDLIPAPAPTNGAGGDPAGDGRHGLAVRMASRLGRDTAYYTLVGSCAFPIAFINAIVLTHYLSPTQYGQLAVLLFVSGLTSVVLNLMFLRGTERQVWGAADEIVDDDDPHILSYEQKLLTLSSGVILSLIAALITIVASVLFAPWLSEHLVHTPHLQSAVIWMGVSGGLGSVWRMVVNTCRWERKRLGFGVSYVVRPAVAFALSWPLAAAGKGVTGVMMATGIATLASILVAVWYARNSLRLVLHWSAARNIGRSSGNYAAMVVGLYVLHSGDTWFLSRFGKIADVGVYKLATNIASFVSYAVSGFLMAWGPLERSSLFAASYDRYGHPRMRSEFMQYYMIAGIFLVLALVAVSSPLIALFAPSYHPAEKFIPITSVGYLAYGLVLVVARGSTFPRRYVVYGVAAISGAVGLAVTSAILAPKIGGYGVAAGDIVGGLVATAVILVIAKLFGHVPTVDRRRLTALLAIGAACYSVSTWIAPLTSGPVEALLKVASVVVFVILMLVSGAIPAHHRRALWQIIKGSLLPGHRSPMLVDRAVALPRTDRMIVTGITRDRQSVARVAVLTGLPERTVRRRFVAALKQIAEVETPPSEDEGIARYLLDIDSITAQDRLARELWEYRRVPAAALLDIESTFKSLRSAPAKMWAESEEQSGHDLNLESRPLDPLTLVLLDEVVRRGEPNEAVAPRLGLRSSEIDRQLVAALRSVDGDGASHPADSLIGAFLHGGSGAPPASQLWAAGVDPIELHDLELTLAGIRKVSQRRWERIARSNGVAVVEDSASQKTH
jgi:O-antigen/teichoic acid export membrane protein